MMLDTPDGVETDFVRELNLLKSFAVRALFFFALTVRVRSGPGTGSVNFIQEI